MVKLEFKRYDKNNDLDFFNKILIKASQDRYELKKAVNSIYYLYDYDEREIVRNKVEMKDIIECQFLENFCNDVEYKRIENILTEVF